MSVGSQGSSTLSAASVNRCFDPSSASFFKSGTACARPAIDPVTVRFRCSHPAAAIAQGTKGLGFRV